MKKLLLICLVVSMVLGAILPSVAYAKPGDDLAKNGIEILKKGPPTNLKKLGQQIKNFMANRGKFQVPSEPAGFLGPQVKGEKYAIVIGINDYPGPNSVLNGGLDLFYADNDAQAVFNMLVGVEGYKPQNVIVLTDRNATQSGILNQIAALKKKVKPNDEVVFYFSGHSAQYTGNAVTSLSRIGDKSGIVVWADDLNENNPAVIWDTQLRTAFNGFKTDRIIFGFDCCYAGGFNDLAAPGRIVVMASDGDGITGEYGEAYASLGAVELLGIGWMDQGLFTYFFIVQGLTWGLADLNGDGIVTVEEAFCYAQPILQQWTDANAGSGLDEIPVMIDMFRGDLEL